MGDSRFAFCLIGEKSVYMLYLYFFLFNLELDVELKIQVSLHTFFRDNLDDRGNSGGKKISIHSSEAMLDPNCLYGTMVAAANAVSHLASVGPIAREKLRKRYVSMVKAPGGSWGKPGGLGWKVLNRTGQEFLAKLWQFPYMIHRGTFLSLLACILNQP